MAYFGEGTGPIHVDNVRCTGTERSLADCVKQELGRHNCRHSEDAGVICDYFGKKASGNSSAGESPLGPAQAEAAAPAPRPEQTPRTADQVWGIHAAWAPRAVLGGRGPPCAHSAEGRAPGGAASEARHPRACPGHALSRFWTTSPVPCRAPLSRNWGPTWLHLCVV